MENLVNEQLINEQKEKAANHFIELYGEEISEVTSDAIYEWWGLTVDQYNLLKKEDYTDIEKLIFQKLIFQKIA